MEMTMQQNVLFFSAARFFCSLTVVVILTLGAPLSFPAVAADDPLRVGMELSYPPFEMTDINGRPSGVSVSLAKAIGQHLGREVIIENIAFDGLIAALRTGTIDCIISSMTATPERARSIAFSQPYLTTGLTLLVGRDAPIESAADLDRPGVRVAVKLGTTAHKFATRGLTQAQVFVLNRESAAVLEVIQGKVDAFIYDSLSIYRQHRRHPDTTRALLTPFRKETWAIGLRKSDKALRQQIDLFLEQFKQEGGFEKLGDEFLREEKAYFKRNGIPFYF